MDTDREGIEQPACRICGQRGFAHAAGCPNGQFFTVLPGAPGPPFSVSPKTVLNAMARALNGRSVGDTGGSGMRIDIRDSIVLLNGRDITGVHSISVNLSTLEREGYEKAAEGLKEITEAVTRCLEISAAERSELLDMLDELSRQALLMRSKRAKPGVVKGILAAVATGLSAVGGLAEVWSTWGPAIERFFRA
jgi:hypothetical protein